MQALKGLFTTAVQKANHYGQWLAKQDGRTLRAGTEGEVDEIKEIEYTVYARLTDFTQLEKAASCEKQEQWELRIDKTDQNAAGGRIRVRKTEVAGAEPTYVSAIKMKAASNDGGPSESFEIEAPSSDAAFIAFRFMSEQGMVKHRYRYPIVGTELVWELDAYPNDQGGYHEWVKLDLEVKSATDQLPELPLNFADVILPKGMGDLSEDEWEAKVQVIYQQCFISKNPYLKQETPVDTQEPEIEGEGEQPKVTQPEGSKNADTESAPGSDTEPEGAGGETAPETGSDDTET